MKKITFTLIMALLSIVIQAQSNPPQEDLTYIMNVGDKEYRWTNEATFNQLGIDTATRTFITNTLAGTPVSNNDTANRMMCMLEVDCSNIVDMDLDCRANLPAVDFDLPIINNACPTIADATLSALTIIPGNSGCPGDAVIVPRTYFIQDMEGNMTQCEQTFTIESTNAPTLTPTTPLITEMLDANCEFALLDYTGTITLTSDCTAPAITQSPAPGTVILGVATTTVTFEVTDFCGRMASTTIDVVTEDMVPPTAMCVAPFVVQLDDMGMASITAADVDNGSTDACGIASTSIDVTDFTCADVGTPITVTLTVTDNNMNTATCTTTVTVEDNVLPEANCVAAITIALDENGNATIEGQATPVTSVSGSIDNTDPQFARPNGNGTSCSTTTGADHFYDVFAFTIDVADMYTFSMPNNIGPDFYFLLYEGGFDPASPCMNFIEGNDDTNGTEPELMIQLNLVPGNYELVTSTFSGNAAEGPYTYSVASAAGGNVFEAGAVNGLIIDAGSSDNCDVASIVASQVNFTCADVGENTVILTITDVNGNESMCTTVVTVEDNTPVVISAGPSDIFTGTGPNAGDCETLINYDPITAASFTVEDDNCFDTASITVTQTGGLGSGAMFPVGTTVEEYTLTDANGNETVFTFEVNITDTTLPLLDCPSSDVVVASDDEGNFIIEDYTSIATDNCTAAADLVLTQEPAAGTVVTDPSTTSITVTATDEAGNTQTCTFNLVVDDTLSIEDTTLQTIGVSMYPNPAASQVTLDAGVHNIDKVTVYDLAGRKVTERNVSATSHQLDVSSFSTSVYLVQIQSGDTIITKRLIKQ